MPKRSEDIHTSPVRSEGCIQYWVFGILISNTEHRTPNVEMKLECLNVKVVATLGVFTQCAGKIFSIASQ